MLPYVIVAGCWILAMICGIAKLDVANRRRMEGLIEDSREYLEGSNDEAVEDAKFREVDDFHEVRKRLKNFGEKDENIRIFTKQAIADLDATKELQENLQELKRVSFNPAVFKNIEGTLQVLQRDIIQNGKDIITILVSCKHGKKFDLDEEEFKSIKQELVDNRRRLDKFNMLMREGAKYATQKDSESSDLDLDSWNVVFKQLNTPPINIRGTG